MNIGKILTEVRENIGAVIARDSTLGNTLWDSFIQLHPADIADFLADLPVTESQQIFTHLPRSKPLNNDC